ncbi:MAG: methionine biosynthesis protein MetW, partial [Candidatus Hodarchaeota archaeon]
VLEHVYKPLYVLKEAMRVGQKVMISSPNYAFIGCRMQLLLGRAPTYAHFGDQWHNSQHIRLFSYTDFKNVLRALGWGIKNRWYWATKIPRFLFKFFPNLLSLVFVIEIERKKK